MLTTALWALGGALSLVFLYQHIRINWPQSYFGPTESLALYFSGTGARYVVFRFLPPYVAFLAIGVYSPGPITTAVTLTAGTYAILSTALSVRSSLRRERDSVQLSRSRIAVLVTIVLGLGLCAFAAIRTVPVVAPSAPPLADVAANLIAALIAATLAVAYFAGTVGSSRRHDDLSDDVVYQIRMIALDSGADQQLAVAIAYVENLQRPAWFRRVERISAPLHRDGTFGLFQVKGHGPVDDMESCRIATRALRGIFPLLNDGYPVDWSVRQAAEKHNPDSRFAEMVAEAYFNLPAYPIEASPTTAPDGRPLLEVSAVGRFGESMAIRGTFWSPTETIVVDAYRPTDPVPAELAPDVVINESGRSTWRTDLAPGTLRIVVRTFARLDDCFTTEQLELDLRHIEVARDLTLR